MFREAFRRITVKGKELLSIKPELVYDSHDASIVTSEEFLFLEPEFPPSLPQIESGRV